MEGWASAKLFAFYDEPGAAARPTPTAAPAPPPPPATGEGPWVVFLHWRGGGGGGGAAGGAYAAHHRSARPSFSASSGAVVRWFPSALVVHRYPVESFKLTLILGCGACDGTETWQLGCVDASSHHL
jgi:hypothetical protein